PTTSVGTATSVTIPFGDSTSTNAILASVTSIQRGQTYYWLVRACADSVCTVYTDANDGQYQSFTALFRTYLPLTLR
ncbi:hypothetical protein, partial [Chloroflexus sp.]|uniref:hypothetical protein n=1 Tax=Chloroflexus sp. TaxID=1904827 RepID=UPI002ADE71A8